LIATSSFGSIQPLTLAGILRHELGHILGFRHEHIRPEAGAVNCPHEDDSWHILTEYDPASVMHYPQGNGTNTGDLNLTTVDQRGVHVVYPRLRGDNILWRDSDGTVATWYMDGGPSYPGRVTFDWTIKGTGDFHGDGKSDILWSNGDGT